MSKPSVAVLMSTYNGEKFIKEQIESILNQKDVEITLFIRDDGSTDGTLDLIRSYTCDNKVSLFSDGLNLRPGLSFLTLLKRVFSQEPEYDYYAFADQDDIWLEIKLISAINLIKKSEKPALYCSNQIIYRNGKREGLRFSEKPDMSLLGHITTNSFSGCTMLFDNNLAEIIVSKKMPEQDFLIPRCHDSWIYLIACVAGKVVYDSNSYILYRIHNDNVVGIRKMSFNDKVLRFFQGKVKHVRSQSAKYLLDAFPNISFQNRKYVEEIAYYKKNIKSRIRLIQDREYCKSKNENSLSFMIKVILGYL